MSAPPVLLGNVQPTLDEKTKAIQPPAPTKVEVTFFETAVASCLAVLAGILLVTQGGINTNLKANCLSSPFPSACLNFSVGAVTVSTVSLMHKRDFSETTLRKARWYCYLGGVFGPIYVTTAIFLAARLGFAVFQLCAITGQLASSLACDGVGLLHLTKRPPTPKRIFAVVLVLVGAGLTSSNVDFGDEPMYLVAVYAFITFCAGVVVPLQACCNVAMGAHVKTPFRAVAMSFAVGASFLMLLSIISVAASGSMIEVQGGEWWMWCGGIVGCTLVTCNVLGVPKLGAGAFTTLFLAGQLVTALFYDSVGAFGFPVKSPTMSSVVGTLVAVFGAVLYQFNIQLVVFNKATATPSISTENIRTSATGAVVASPVKRSSIQNIRTSVTDVGVVSTVKKSSIRLTADEVEAADEGATVADPMVGRAKRSSQYGVA